MYKEKKANNRSKQSLKKDNYKFNFRLYKNLYMQNLK